MNNIAILRKEKGLTQQDLATKAQISRGHLVVIEKGESLPSGRTLKKIAAALNCSIADLLKE